MTFGGSQGKVKRKRSRPSTSTSTPVKDNERELNGVEKEHEQEQENVQDIKMDAELAKTETLRNVGAAGVTVVDMPTTVVTVIDKQIKGTKEKTEKNKEKSEIKSKLTDEEQSLPMEAIQPLPPLPPPTITCNGNISQEDFSICRFVYIRI